MTKKTTSAHIIFSGLISIFFFLGCNSSEINAQQTLEKIRAPEGFSVEIYADNVPNARQMVLGANATVYVGSRGAGKVYAIVDQDGDFKADTVYTIAEDLRLPSGVAYKDGALYVGAVNKILRYDRIDTQLAEPPEPVVVTDSYPTDGHHGWKFIAFGPDNKLYVPVGAPCNICEPDKEIYATITRINADGSGREIVARGVRNSVGFDWHPDSGELWFTDNGRDWLGDNRPPGELNRVREVGQHFGYPYKHGDDIWDPEFGAKGKKMNRQFISPAQKLDPHVAPLGMIFYTGSMFPRDYKNQVLIAEHGSWNRSKKIGYRITKVSIKDGKATGYQPFIDGWLQPNEAVWGRPADLLELSDGSVLISDDHKGIIYRVTYNSQIK